MACVGQGVVYVGGAVGALRVMAARAEHARKGRRVADGAGEEQQDDAEGGG